jgi:DNA-directed RNA polymerase subunit alpha
MHKPIIKYGKFELPTKVKIEAQEEEDFNKKARIIAGPFERGFGHTIGTSLRRIMLTSLESPAIVSIELEGFSHEYMACEGIIEDMTLIILNVKGALLRRLPMGDDPSARSVKTIVKELEVTSDMIEGAKGSYKVTLGDVVADGEFEVLNKDHVLFTVTKPMTRRIAFKVVIGRGYKPSEEIKLPNKVVNEIYIDAIFSPVRIINYFVENARVGGETDMDRLVLEITTDGRITPKEALTYATQIANLHFSVFDEMRFQTISYEDDQEELEGDRDTLLNKLYLKINEIELSVRSTNCLQQANIDTIAELVIMPEPDMLKFRNFGKKSLNEIKAKLDEMELYLGMDLSKYGITRENVKEMVKTLADKA